MCVCMCAQVQAVGREGTDDETERIWGESSDQEEVRRQGREAEGEDQRRSADSERKPAVTEDSREWGAGRLVQNRAMWATARRCSRLSGLVICEVGGLWRCGQDQIGVCNTCITK